MLYSNDRIRQINAMWLICPHSEADEIMSNCVLFVTSSFCWKRPFTINDIYICICSIYMTSRYARHTQVTVDTSFYDLKGKVYINICSA